MTLNGSGQKENPPHGYLLSCCAVNTFPKHLALKLKAQREREWVTQTLSHTEGPKTASMKVEVTSRRGSPACLARSPVVITKKKRSTRVSHQISTASLTEHKKHMAQIKI